MIDYILYYDNQKYYAIHNFLESLDATAEFFYSLVSNKITLLECIPTFEIAVKEFLLNVHQQSDPLGVIVQIPPIWMIFTISAKSRKDSYWFWLAYLVLMHLVVVLTWKRQTTHIKSIYKYSKKFKLFYAFVGCEDQIICCVISCIVVI